MRWIPFLVLAYLTVVVQTSLGRLLAFGAGSAGTVQPDALAWAAVFVAMFARSSVDVMLSGWVLGLLADLTTGAVVGVMPIAYALSAGAVFRVREAFFREKFSTKVMLTLVFCLLAHGMWVTGQSLLAWRAMTWGAYGRVLLQAALLSAYTAALAPAAHWLLGKAEPLLLGAPAGRGRR
jgi:rod shape-determining protein MreD